ncbi:hypothetical protein [Streptomyces sp. NBC_01767]|uniref:hypothetical protein n=1 Tax=Streptomyces sp. NBC_01767 TaxID=2975937 RepID=UPI0022588A8E|nr:hypothetical protein [Streptomyces sp. NBC_01767]MCX4396004.1 hypothetical protein [Streptomyces sp. NBC_01767]
MSNHPRTAARSGGSGGSAAYAALLLALSVLLSLLIPAGAAQAYAPAATAPDATVEVAADATADEDCAVLPLSGFGEAAPAEGRPTIPGDTTACFTFTAETAGLHKVVVVGGANGSTYASVLDGGTEIDCYDPKWGAGWCRLPRSGEFTLRLFNDWSETSRPTVAVVPLATTEGCAPAIGTSWDTAPVVGSAAGPTAIQCQIFNGTPGERITNTIRTTAYGQSLSWITDETGARICPYPNEDGSNGCVLPGDGPYRVLSQVSEAENGFPAEYTLAVRRTSDPAGCAHPALNGYNSGPTAADPAHGCRTFTAPAAGRYDAYSVHDGARSLLAVYDRNGRTACATWDVCTLPAAGEYTVYTDAATLVIDHTATTGCEPVELGVHRSEFSVGGEIDCLSLPLPEGARLAALEAISGPAPHPDVTVVDADGIQRCDPSRLTDGTCGLTGKAPFRALVSNTSESKPTGPYALVLHRTDAAGDCPAFPAGDFTETGPTARVTTGDGVFSRCLSIPADDHSTQENIQLRAAPGTASLAQFTVLDVQGKQICSARASTSTWTTCALTPGVAHTVLVTGRDTPAEYVLARRDVTTTAKGCTANPATKPGGPSTGSTMGAPGELRCRQVTTADAKDTLHIDVRDPLGAANIVVYGADGTGLCNKNRACAVTGSTHYQVMVTVPATLKAPGSYRFDALRIAGPDGPAAECEKVASIAYGYGPVTGTLDEQHTAVCAALPTGYSDRFKMEISDTTGATETAVPALYDPSLDNGCVYGTPGGYSCSVMEQYSRELTPSILVFSLPENASKTSYKAEAVCSGLCGLERVAVTKVAPTTGVSGTRTTVTVTGTALHKDDRVVLSVLGRRIEATTVAVAPDRRTLTAELDLTGEAEGTWGLSVITHGGTQYLKGDFTITPAPLRNSAPPSIGTTARVGDRLTASPGTWAPAPTSYAYQWNADGQPITGATASGYTVPVSLLGKKIGVTVTARRTGTADVPAASAALTVAKGAAPRVTTAPKITGSVKVGAKLTTTSGSWTPAASSYGYQWKADGKAIKGATASTYTVPASLLGKYVTVTVTAHRTGHTDGSTTPASVEVATGSAPKATKQPTISGTAKVGRTLKAAKGSWTPAPTSYGYQWYANGKAISGATKSSLTLKSAQRGKKITVKVTARRTGHASGSATSRATRAVAR